jgi:hypothetical protein
MDDEKVEEETPVGNDGFFRMEMLKLRGKHTGYYADMGDTKVVLDWGLISRVLSFFFDAMKCLSNNPPVTFEEAARKPSYTRDGDAPAAPVLSMDEIDSRREALVTYVREASGGMFFQFRCPAVCGRCLPQFDRAETDALEMSMTAVYTYKYLGEITDQRWVLSGCTLHAVRLTAGRQSVATRCHLLQPSMSQHVATSCHLLQHCTECCDPPFHAGNTSVTQFVSHSRMRTHLPRVGPSAHVDSALAVAHVS